MEDAKIDFLCPTLKGPRFEQHGLPKESYEHFTEVLHCHSIGVLAVTVNDCANNSLSVLEDSATFWSHALIDFSQKSNGETRKIAEHLRDIALTRGWVYGGA